ncbi:MAG: hypothetical protein A2233_01750 [Candidatus Kerfeldbacteria bacterium RIFOXYA2_FULL_38_24]|uniref:UDP-N-acetylmuramyl-tripeptide synthetase n=1 Tax=Candidatus Kerfeldbacteria bacterium RIFOXYB2_FULL_38_14 TaxID=1798547 RepID=A0A1G2BES0_9BACT|nr:MAG: hypothetical protein A2319_04355 [Candidatus Kerfeldbacteria bacterium RIFOXYB2_FULL_38_14]OGY87843.1 MAG: hypothetical protein A2233_01750 [Candidatus Kerfeldbacteria bacterium RIFOXYA2_FULL_38_24]OGY88430.1 MAG: hypothetical protein A2458_00575 [Candidatus Kerfeldbacteria bacterium RIFOXYC2_FULL_38_9]
MPRIKEIIKKLLPKSALGFYHKFLARFAAIVYNNPSKKMVVVGVTGTKGKTTVGNVLWRLLTDAGFKVGLTGTANYRIGEQEFISHYKMSMLGRFKLQQWLARMVRAKCQIAIVETTSEGISQWRHLGIHYDVCAFTNLYPEHLEAHGSFANYKKAKLQLFEHLAALPEKKINNKIITKQAIINMDNEHAQDFFKIGKYKKIRIGASIENEISISDIIEYGNKTTFTLNKIKTEIPLLGFWNVYNVLIAAGTAEALGVDLENVAKSLPGIEQIPGRMEHIDCDQSFTVIVDYAHEPKGLELLYSFWKKIIPAENKLITLISSTGGGRDQARRKRNGIIAAKYCDYLIVTDEDPYDDDPQKIINEVATGAIEAGAVLDQNMWKILDRREAIRKAFSLAQANDVVFLTAKGAEQCMVIKNGQKIPWDDRKVAREELVKK